MATFNETLQVPSATLNISAPAVDRSSGNAIRGVGKAFEIAGQLIDQKALDNAREEFGIINQEAEADFKRQQDLLKDLNQTTEQFGGLLQKQSASGGTLSPEDQQQLNNAESRYQYLQSALNAGSINAANFKMRAQQLENQLLNFKPHLMGSWNALRANTDASISTAASTISAQRSAVGGSGSNSIVESFIEGQAAVYEDLGRFQAEGGTSRQFFNLKKQERQAKESELLLKITRNDSEARGIHLQSFVQSQTILDGNVLSNLSYSLDLSQNQMVVDMANSGNLPLELAQRVTQAGKLSSLNDRDRELFLNSTKNFFINRMRSNLAASGILPAQSESYLSEYSSQIDSHIKAIELASTTNAPERAESRQRSVETFAYMIEQLKQDPSNVGLAASLQSFREASSDEQLFQFVSDTMTALESFDRTGALRQLFNFSRSADQANVRLVNSLVQRLDSDVPFRMDVMNKLLGTNAPSIQTAEGWTLSAVSEASWRMLHNLDPSKYESHVGLIRSSLNVPMQQLDVSLLTDPRKRKILSDPKGNKVQDIAIDIAQAKQDELLANPLNPNRYTLSMDGDTGEIVFKTLSNRSGQRVGAGERITANAPARKFTDEANYLYKFYLTVGGTERATGFLNKLLSNYGQEIQNPSAIELDLDPETGEITMLNSEAADDEG